MKKSKTRKIGSLEEIEMEGGLNEVLKYSPVDLADEINTMLDNKPATKTKEYKEWRNKINIMMQKYNDLAGMRIFVSIR